MRKKVVLNRPHTREEVALKRHRTREIEVALNEHHMREKKVALNRHHTRKEVALKRRRRASLHQIA